MKQLVFNPNMFDAYQKIILVNNENNTYTLVKTTTIEDCIADLENTIKAFEVDELHLFGNYILCDDIESKFNLKFSEQKKIKIVRH